MACSLHIEKCNERGIMNSSSWGGLDPTIKISVVYDMAIGWSGWRTYRHAIGVSKNMGKPSGLRWTPAFSEEYDPTIQELFQGIILKEDEDYFSLISRLDVNLRHNTGNTRDIAAAVYRYQDLYMHLPRIPPSEGAAVTEQHDDPWPTSPRDRDKARDTDTGGGSRAGSFDSRGRRRLRLTQDVHSTRSSISELIDALSYY